MTSIFSRAWTLFWTDSFWLPEGTKWEDFQDTSLIRYPKFIHVCYPVALSILVIFIRFLVERYIFMPWGLKRGLKPTKKVLVTNHVMEQAYVTSRRTSLNHSEIKALAKRLDWSERQVERWMFHRRQQNRPSQLVKLTESGWRFTYYSFAVLYGLYALWDKPWFWDMNECWRNFPHQDLTWDIWFYYVFQLSCYWSMLFSQFVDVQRKDFTEMFLHHLCTILLITFSFTCNLVRGGSLVLLVHDCADIFMEAAKMFKYTKWQRGCDICFGTFFVVWTITRLVILPGKLMKNFFFDAETFFPKFPAFTALKLLLLSLFCLHLVWTYFIVKILYRALLSGKTEKDSRSSSSEGSGIGELSANSQNKQS